jgi:hypothetical protein
LERWKIPPSAVEDGLLHGAVLTMITSTSSCLSPPRFLCTVRSDLIIPVRSTAWFGFQAAEMLLHLVHGIARVHAGHAGARLQSISMARFLFCLLWAFLPINNPFRFLLVTTVKRSRFDHG